MNIALKGSRNAKNMIFKIITLTISQTKLYINLTSIELSSFVSWTVIIQLIDEISYNKCLQFSKE